MVPDLTDFDRRLLDAIQRRVPLVARPYAQLADELGAAEEAVLARVAALGGPGGIIREIAGIFDAVALGCESALVAAEVAPASLDRAGQIVAGHPGVSHCYGRGGELNLWFTLTVGPDSTLGLARSVATLGRLIEARHILPLPTVRRYKLEVRFDMVGEEEDAAPIAAAPHTPVASPQRPDDRQLAAIRRVQIPLPAVPDAFEQLAREQGLSADELLVHAADFLAVGWLRRYSAVLRHREAGAACNVMVAWQVPPAQADAFGTRAAAFRQVSHCYLRITGAGWPFNLYTMVHARSQDETERIVRELRESAGDFPHLALPTLTEYKKAKVRLFSPQLRAWESDLA